MKREFVAVVLAGGAGNRFWPLTTNKIVFPFLGSTLFDFSVRAALPKDVSRAVIVASRDNRDALGAVRLPIPSVTVLQQKPLGMADALLASASEIAGSELLIVIADDLMESGLIKRVVARGRTSGAFGVIPGWKTEKYFPGGYLKTENHRIVGITEKPGEGKTPSPYVGISGHYIRSSDVLLDEIKRTRPTGDDVYERAMTSLMQHEEFVMEPYEGMFVSLKYPWHVLDSMENLLSTRIKSHRGKGVEIRDTVVIEGDVYLDDGVKIFENTKIVGPCYIGKHSIIGNNNLIRHSHIGANCVSGFNTDITRSYIGNNCWFHSNYVGDSVLEGNISMGSGTVLANLKLDEENIASYVKGDRIDTAVQRLGAMIGRDVRLGVNVSVMPGIKIGSGSFIGAGVIVDKDVPEQSYCQANAGFTITRNIKTVFPRSTDQFKY